jgi:hypothetical protein
MKFIELPLCRGFFKTPMFRAFVEIIALGANNAIGIVQLLSAKSPISGYINLARVPIINPSYPCSRDEILRSHQI